MSVTSDERLAAQVARELSLPEPGMHFGASLLIATFVSSPLLIAGATGRHPVPLVLAAYVGVLIVVWFLAGIFASALSLRPASRLGSPEPTEPSPPVVDESLGSNSAH